MRRIVLLPSSAALAVLFACGVALVTMQEPAHAAFPGQNGKIAFVRITGDYWESDLYLMGPDGANPTRITIAGESDSQPALSPDGTRIAFVSSRQGSYGYDIYVMKAAPEGPGNQPVRLTTDYGSQFFPAFSPDGSKIAYTSSDGQIWIMNAKDGSGKRMLTNDAVRKREPEWSPDGKRMAYVTSPDTGASDVFAINVDGTGESTNLTNSPEDESDVAFSPDGRSIAFSRLFDFYFDWGVDSDWEIFVKDLSSGEETNVTNDAQEDEILPAFSPDGIKVAFTRAGEIFTANATDGSAQTNITNSPSSDQQPHWGTVPPPDTAIISGPSGTVRTASASFGFSSEAGAKFECSLDNSAFAPCAPTKGYAGLTNGLHTFKVRATNATGNIDPTPASRTWRVDTVRPSGRVVINGGATTTRSRTVKLALRATDPAPASGVVSMRFKNAGTTTWSAWQKYATAKSWTLTVGKGTKTVHVQYRDKARNVSAAALDSIAYRP